MTNHTTGNILVTGGAGYIGSHACVALLEAGYGVVVVDNFSNSQPSVVNQIQRITGKAITLIEGDIRDRATLESLLKKHPVDAVMHFAGLKAVGESCQHPLRYYENNVLGSINLFAAMQQAGVQRLIFSSSATVYGFPETVPINESAPLNPYNPYGNTKLAVENILRDLCRPGAESLWQVALLRYFNPIGAHPSGLIGENPNGIPNNLLPYVAQVAAGKRDALPVFGNDYPTADGTGVRDYIHVTDLVHGHVLALAKLLALPAGVPFCQPYNLGTGQGYSVLEIIQAFEQINQVKVPYRIMPRREGDVAACWADPSLAARELGWKAGKTLADMLSDGWRWQQYCSETGAIKPAS